MADLGELYQQIILDHNRNPRNFRALLDADRQAEGYNPICGDEITVYAKLDGERLADLAFQGKGCAISQASASLMTQALRGKTTREAEELFHAFHDLVTAAPDAAITRGETLGKLVALAGVRAFPVRVKCASLPWHTLRAAVKGTAKPVSTE